MQKRPAKQRSIADLAAAKGIKILDLRAVFMIWAIRPPGMLQ